MANTNSDGGYYAIKGFLYQFDKTLIEVLRNPDELINFEHCQDISYQQYVIQVKHKEKATYSPHTIRKAILQLLELFRSDPTRRFCLYCHFSDQPPHQRPMSRRELDQALGGEAEGYSDAERGSFVASLVLQFSHDYYTQFEDVLALIRKAFRLRNQDRAVIYHSIIQQRLLHLTLEAPAKRCVSFQDLCSFVQGAERTIVYGGYSDHLAKHRYEQAVHHEFFTFKRANIEPFERLFVIDVFGDVSAKRVALLSALTHTSHKYFRRGKSPAPYVCLRGMQEADLVALKQELWDTGMVFFDGTFFDGDGFRCDELVKRENARHNVTLKLIPEKQICQVLERIRMQEVYQFYREEPMDLSPCTGRVAIEIDDIDQITRMLAS